jgi:hypothetical protein
LNLRVNRERLEGLTIDEQIALQESSLDDGEPRLRDFVSAISRLMVDEAGHYLEPAKARRLLGKMTNAEVKIIGQTVSNALEESAVPPESTTA